MRRDPALTTAAHALSRFDPLGALKLIALREEPAALMLRGIAMAQLGDPAAARKLLRRAATGDLRARGLAALGEIALAERDLRMALRDLSAAAKALDDEGDRTNGVFVRLQLVRRLLLLGKVAEADRVHTQIDPPPPLKALAALVRADIEMRSMRPKAAKTALARARAHATSPALGDEIERLARELAAPVARLVRDGAVVLVTLEELEMGDGFVVDACRREVRCGGHVVSLAKRPVLLGLAVELGKDVEATREQLAKVFGARRVDDSLRARLRVEIGRLRRALAGLAEIAATASGWALRPRALVVLPPEDGDASAIVALLRTGESWSTSALALALHTGQRSIQRALAALEEAGRVASVGGGRGQRWVARPPEGFATNLLLLGRLAAD